MAAAKNGGRLVCQACSFDFFATYGEVGQFFIEGHHTKPVSELGIGSKTKVSEIALVCSNCHRMLHRKRPWPTIEGLASLVQAQKATRAG